MPKADLVVITKLQPPQIKKKVLRREQLLNLLNKNLDKKLILICADAGYGKTTLLAQLCTEFDKPFIFYSLEATDNDLATFFKYITHGVRHNYPDFGERTRGILTETRNIEILVGTFINEFDENIKKNFYIVLDDYHYLQTNKEIAKALDYLLHHSPINLHLVIASRETPPFNLAYYLAKQELIKIEKEQLRFDLKEIQTLLSDVYELDIPSSEIQQLEQHSEGWITAIQLILQKISILGEDAVKKTLNDYIASGEEIFNYFAHEIFENQSNKFQEFLMKTSILESLDTDVCNYMLKTKNSQEILSRLENQHIFISRLDNKYKYHPLFKDFLNKHLISYYNSVELIALYKSVGKYFLKNEKYELSVEYFLKIKHFHRASLIIKKVGSDLIDIGKFNLINDWLKTLPESMLLSDVGLILLKSGILINQGNWTEALTGLRKAKRLCVKNKRNLCKIFLQTARILGYIGNFRQAADYAKRALALSRLDRKLEIEALNRLGSLNAYKGNYRDATRRFEQAISLLKKSSYREEITLLHNFAALTMAKGEFLRALSVFQQIIRVEGAMIAKSSAYGNMSVAYVELGDFFKARECIKEALRLAKRVNDQRTLNGLLINLGNFYLEQKYYNKAILYFSRALTKADELKESKGGRLRSNALFGLSKVYLRLCELVKAREYINRVIEDSGHQINISTHEIYLTKGLIEFQSKNFGEAKKIFNKCLKVIKNSGFNYNLMRNNYYLAKLYQKMHKEKALEYFLQRTLSIARVNNYENFVVVNEKADRSLLNIAQEKGIEDSFVITIQTRIEQESKIEVQMFKDFLISIDGIPVIKNRWSTKKSQSIFQFLLLNRKRTISKDQLIDRFFSKAKLSAADHSIRTEIYRVNKALGDIRFINYKTGNYYINPNLDIKIDVEEFENLAKATRSDYRNGRLDKAIGQARKALLIYKDDFLKTSFDEWCEERRSYYRRLNMEILDTLGKCYFSLKKYGESLQYFEKSLAVDGLSESANSGIIKCYLNMGQERKALLVYQDFERLLEKQLNLKPSLQITELIKSISINAVTPDNSDT